MGATLFVTGLPSQQWVQSIAGSRAHAFRIEVETTQFHTVSASHGVARCVSFSNEAVWSELVSESFATTARTTPFHPEMWGEVTSSADEPGLPVVVAVLQHLTNHPDHQLLVSMCGDPDSQARAHAVVALLEGDRCGFGSAVARLGDPARAAAFDRLEADAAEQAGGAGPIAWLRRRLAVAGGIPISDSETAGARPDLVEVLFIEVA
ncbi:MAG: hypothetical protein H0T42_16865 [Deltaproteobacteria bacterium]|nr:hypothetical protein [Deltaproteobacteria bacterium]